MAKRKRRPPQRTDKRTVEESPQRQPIEPARAYTRADWIALAAFFASGFVALVYELCWIRKSAVAFGTASFALSTVLAVFFGGLSLGSYLFGQRAASFRRPLRVYAWLEIGISAWAAATPLIFAALDMVYGVFFRMSDHSFAVLTIVRALLVVVAILPATVLMGASLPIFCRHFVTNANRVSAPIGLLYGVNTLGAAVGCAICGFVLIPTIGVFASLGLAVAINLAMAGVMFSVAKKVPPVEPETESAKSSATTSDVAVVRLYRLFFATGFVALGYEVLWSRYLSLLILNNIYNHTLTITVILVGIVLGSLLSSRFGDRSQHRALLFGVLQITSGVTVLGVLLMPPGLFGNISPDQFGLTVTVCTIVLLPPAILSGASFPLAMSMAVTQVSHAASRVGLMTAMNTVGGIVGSLLVGFVVLPFLGMQQALRLLTGGSVLIGVAALLLFDKTLSRNTRGIVILIAAGIWIGLPNLLATRLPHDFLHGGRELREVSEGIGSNMAVIKETASNTVQLEINRLWQGQDRKNHQVMAAHIPCILHSHPKSVLMVGVGCGQTASRFLMHDIESLECVEIEGALVNLIARHFPRSWLEDPRCKVIIEDGRNYLAHTAKKFDIISLEVGQVFRPGVAGFYTADFYRSARKKLNSDGLLCQFVPINLLTPVELRTILKTFLQTFPQSTLWYNRAELLLIGKNAERFTFDLQRLKSLTRSAADDMTFAYWSGPKYAVKQANVFLAGLLAGPDQLAKMSAGGLIYRDDRPWLEYRLAPKNSIQAENANFVGDHLIDAGSLLSTPLSKANQIQVNENRTLNIKSLHAQALIESGIAMGRHGQVEQAIRAFEQAEQMLPMHLLNQIMLSNGHLQQLDLNKAEEHARRAIQLDPQSADAHFILSQVLHKRGDTTTAQQHLDKANELAPRLRW